MSWKKLTFWTGVVVGAAVGYAVAISLPEEERERLRQTLLSEGETLFETLKEVGGEYVRDLSKEVVERAETLIEEKGVSIPFATGRTNGAAKS